MPVLDNAQHEAFAQSVASGMEMQDAYSKVFLHCSKRSAESSGPRLMRKVVARVAELQASSATELTMDMQERRERLATAARRGLTVKDCDLVAIVLADAKLAGELIEKVEQRDTTPREPLEVVRARFEAAKATHGRS